MSRGPQFSVYGLYDLELERAGERWRVYRLDGGKRRLEHDIIVPGFVGKKELAVFLDDLLHEFSPPGGKIKRL